MELTNNCPFHLIAFQWDANYGRGDEITIAPGETASVPYPGVPEDSGWAEDHCDYNGKFTCTTETDTTDLPVLKGIPAGSSFCHMSGFHIRHFEDPAPTRL